MLQAHPRLRERWWPEDDPTGTYTAEKYLTDRGWVLTRQWFWVPPTLGHYTTAEEMSALCYLVYEWDYGGILRGTMEQKL